MDPTRLAQLKDYVKQSRDAGQTYDQVRAAILGGGWTDDEVNEYLPLAWAETEPVMAAPPAVAPPVVAPATPVVAPTYAAPAAPAYAAPAAAPAYAAGPAPAGSGLGAWISSAWEMYTDAVGPILGGAIIGALVSVVTLGICLPPLTVGLYRMILKRHDEKPFAAGDVFEGFRYFWSAWGVFLVVFAASLVVALPFGLIVAFAAKGDSNAAQGLAVLVNGVQIVISFVVSTLALFAMPLIADDRGGAIAAITTSFNTARADFFNLLIAVVVAQIIGVAGGVACGVGALFTAPLTPCIIAVIYRSRFPAGTMQV